MATDTKKNILSEVTVREAMRKRVVGLRSSSTIADAIRFLVKNKVNALLVTDEDDLPIGVVSKTDIMGAYYAGLPIESPLEHIMVSPPLYCDGEDSLDVALEQMKSCRVYRLYVLEDGGGKATGVLAYPDIVGLLYQFCRACDRSLSNRNPEREGMDDSQRVRVGEVMMTSVCGHYLGDTLVQIMETLSAYRFGALLMTDEAGGPAGVISKTDLILAYKHGVPQETEARAVASTRVISCEETTYLEEAVKTMILSDIHRLFVFKNDPGNITGVFSLSDAARHRSGSCHACMSSRIRVEDSH